MEEEPRPYPLSLSSFPAYFSPDSTPLFAGDGVSSPPSPTRFRQISPVLRNSHRFVQLWSPYDENPFSQDPLFISFLSLPRMLSTRVVENARMIKFPPLVFVSSSSSLQLLHVSFAPPSSLNDSRQGFEPPVSATFYFLPPPPLRMIKASLMKRSPADSPPLS